MVEQKLETGLAVTVHQKTTSGTAACKRFELQFLLQTNVSGTTAAPCACHFRVEQQAMRVCFWALVPLCCGAQPLLGTFVRTLIDISNISKTYDGEISVSKLMSPYENRLAEPGEHCSFSTSLFRQILLGLFSSSDICLSASSARPGDIIASSSSESDETSSSSHRSVSCSVMPLRASMTSYVVCLLASLKKASRRTMFGWFAIPRRAKI